MLAGVFSAAQAWTYWFMALVVWDLEGTTAFPGSLSPTQERIDGREWAGPSWTAYESEIERLNAD